MGLLLDLAADPSPQTPDAASQLEDHIRAAQLPQVTGIAQKVINIIEQRIIDTESLNVECVAHDLHLSKRTLQRRLNNHNSSFLFLRDQLRRYYALNMVLHSTTPLDQIFAILGYADRTCFFKAFTRWTGLSPSTFRRYFRDYNDIVAPCRLFMNFPTEMPA